jgi:antitoxin CptB
MVMDMGDREAARLRWGCRRGMLELDLLLQGFLEKVYPQLARAERECFARLLELPDQLLLEYLLKQAPVEEKEFIDVIERIRAAAAD